MSQAKVDRYKEEKANQQKDNKIDYFSGFII